MVVEISGLKAVVSCVGIGFGGGGGRVDDYIISGGQGFEDRLMFYRTKRTKEQEKGNSVWFAKEGERSFFFHRHQGKKRNYERRSLYRSEWGHLCDTHRPYRP
jgi:hypothetical protein